jgi:hypothetical protein
MLKKWKNKAHALQDSPQPRIWKKILKIGKKIFRKKIEKKIGKKIAWQFGGKTVLNAFHLTFWPWPVLCPQHGMVCPPVTSEAGAHPAGDTKSEHFEPARPGSES